MICSACGASGPDEALACAECGTPAHTLPAMGPGFVLAARYEVLRVLGRGGMGMVYQARDRLLDETVAIKVLRPDVAGSAEIAQRFRAEIKLARTVSHKNVCRIHEYGEDRGIRFISMAFVDGVDLKQVLREQGPLPPRDAFETLLRVADALQAIHDEGIIHRDLKTPNIMIDKKGVVRLMDFGIAKQGEAEGLGMTVTGQIIGTPEYMSPEQVQAQRLDNRSDVYSLGIVAFEVFTGATPFRADTPLGTALKHLNEPPPLEGPQAALVPPAVVPVLRKALAKRREERYASAREMGQALEAARAATSLPTDAIRTTPTAAADAAVPQTQVETLAQPFARRSATTVEGSAAAQATTLLEKDHRRAAGARWPWLAAAAMAMAVVGWLAFRLAAPAGPAPPREEAPAASASSAPPATPLASPSPSLVPPGSVAPPGAGRTAAAGPPASPRPAATRASASPPSSTPPAPASTAALDARVERALAEAEKALEAGSLDTAIARYDEALQLDPRNAIARMGRTSALTARAARAAPAPPAAPAPAKPAFVAGRTVAESAETRPDGALQSAFEDSPGIEVTRDTQPAQLPGRIEFRTDPPAVAPGERYKLEVRFVNSGNAPIELREMTVTTIVNDRRASGPVSPAVSTVAPGQGAAVLSLHDTLREDLRSWSLEIALRTRRGETYRNRLVWTPVAIPAR